MSECCGGHAGLQNNAKSNEPGDIAKALNLTIDSNQPGASSDRGRQKQARKNCGKFRCLMSLYIVDNS